MGILAKIPTKYECRPLCLTVFFRHANISVAAKGITKALAEQKPLSPGSLAQRLEQSAHNRLVAGSNPAGPTKAGTGG